MSHILIVEDEYSLRTDLVDYMSLHGYETTGLGSARELETALEIMPQPRVVILDISLPDGNGFDLAPKIRERFDCGIIMLTAHGDAESRVRGFDSGADIYLVKHTSLREILAAIQSLMRRLPTQDESWNASSEWVLDNTAWRLVPPSGESIKLTSTERAFLDALIGNSGTPCSREDLARLLSNRQTQFDNRHLDAVVSRLRRKIHDHTAIEQPIKSVYGVGYSFSAVGRIGNTRTG
ncbi:response regulator receiver [Nitratireductor indicus C115]|uniref:Response regulator receiver n=1 Tax=Nitratireductor indicus C115 TaxID=1231190 RepID=K2MX22_9HYPH|nr:response regulator transcription factor [Nitratireductor indicus]EKF39818.1 response regulator receiver [Nitratireductor indicus C115]SFQ58036.1 DNA-binding response regulator, OmpR family, contains REC and winged-helix (wHTH) domain [Nitratireductor indicus]